MNLQENFGKIWRNLVNIFGKILRITENYENIKLRKIGFFD